MSLRRSTHAPPRVSRPSIRTRLCRLLFVRGSLAPRAALIAVLGVATAEASSYLPAPPTLNEQLDDADFAGEYEVVTAKTVVLEDGVPVTHVTLRTLTAVHGGSPGGTLILPGGVVDGRFARVLPDAFQVTAGETLFLMLDDAEGLEGYYNVAYGPHIGVFRRVELEGRTLMVDPQGRVVSAITCEGAAIRARPLDEAPVGAVLDEEGRVTSSGGGADLIFVDDPDAAGVRWDDAVDTLASCGGAR